MSLSPTLRLTTRDLDIIASVAVYKFLSTDQIERWYFSSIKHRTLAHSDPATQVQSRHRTAANRLAALTRRGFLSRVFCYPKADTNPHTGRPMAVYYLTRANLAAVRAHLAARCRTSLFDALEDLAFEVRDKTFSPYYLVHELALSEFFLCLEEATHKMPDGGRVVFWERTSPIHRAITERFEATVTRQTAGGAETSSTIYLHFNPDAFFCYQAPDGTAGFYFLEYDNNTEAPERFRKKLGSYLVYRHRKRFPALLTRTAARYQLAIPPALIERAQFKVLITTPDTDRRDALVRVANSLEDAHIFFCTAMSEITPASVLSPIWLRASDYEPIAAEEHALPADIKPAIKSRWRTERIATLPRVAFDD
jgi:hypothetical protein